MSHISNSNPFFTVSAVLLSCNNYIKSKDAINKLKNKYWDKGLYKQHNKLEKKVCFVSRQIRRKQNAFSSHYLGERYDNFIDDLTQLMGQLDYGILACSINKQKLISQYATPEDPYCLSMKFIVERFARFLNNKGATGLIMMESRGDKEDGILHSMFLNSYNKGTEFISSKVIQRTIVGGFWFNQKWNLSKGSQETFPGLEMADLIAHPIGHFVNTEVKSRPFSVFESKFIGYKQYMGKGLKIFP
jgi:hypothetical protein